MVIAWLFCFIKGLESPSVDFDVAMVWKVYLIYFYFASCQLNSFISRIVLDFRFGIRDSAMWPIELHAILWTQHARRITAATAAAANKDDDDKINESLWRNKERGQRQGKAKLSQTLAALNEI